LSTKSGHLHPLPETPPALLSTTMTKPTETVKGKVTYFLEGTKRDNNWQPKFIA